MYKAFAELWGGRYDGTRGQVIIEVEQGGPIEVFKWPDNADPPLGIFGPLVGSLPGEDETLLHYRLDRDFTGAHCLYRLEPRQVDAA